jgi:hypothetical protein
MSLRVLVLLDRVLSAPWRPTGLALRVVHELHARGHELTIVCDSVERPEDFPPAPGCTLVVRRAFCHRQRVGAAALRTFFAQHAHTSPSAQVSDAPSFDVALSMTRLCGSIDAVSHAAVGGGAWSIPTLWLPLGRSAHGFGAELLEALGRPWQPESVLRRVKLTPHRAGRALQENIASREPGAGDRVLLFDAPGGSLRAALARGELGDLSTRVGFVAPVRSTPRSTQRSVGARDAPSVEEARRLGERTRRALAIDSDRVIVLLSADRVSRRRVAPVVEAFAALHRQAGELGAPAPTLVVISSEPGYVHAANASAGLTRFAQGLRVVAPTRRFDALLATADVCATLGAVGRTNARVGIGGGGGSGGGGGGEARRAGLRAEPIDALRVHDPARFVADAMAHRKPTLVLAGSPGESLVRAGERWALGVSAGAGGAGGAGGGGGAGVLGAVGAALGFGVDRAPGSATMASSAGGAGGAGGTGGVGAGVVVSEHSARAWYRAVLAVLSWPRRQASSSAAGAVADVQTLSVARLGEVIERELAELASG